MNNEICHRGKQYERRHKLEKRTQRLVFHSVEREYNHYHGKERAQHGYERQRVFEIGILHSRVLENVTEHIVEEQPERDNRTCKQYRAGYLTKRTKFEKAPDVHHHEHTAKARYDIYG